MDANTIILFALGMVQAVIAFFLKRILTQMDKASEDITKIILDLAKNYVKRPDLEALRKEVSELRHWKINQEAGQKTIIEWMREQQ